MPVRRTESQIVSIRSKKLDRWPESQLETVTNSLVPAVECYLALRQRHRQSISVLPQLGE